MSSSGRMAENVLRFAVGTPTAHSATWRVWHSGARDELYVATRQLAAWIKVSLHASGDFRYAYTRKHVEAGNGLVSMDKRLIDGWHPLEVKPGAWRTLAILEPWFSANLSYPLSGSVTLVPPPPDGHEKLFHVVVLRAGLNATGDAPRLGPVHLPSGATAWVLVLEQPMTAKTFADLDRLRRTRVQRPDGTLEPDIRILTSGIDDAGVGFLRDVPVDLAEG